MQVLSLRNRDFLKAARVRGERSSYIIVAEIMPTMTSLIVATFLGSRRLRRAHRGRPAVHRARRPQRAELGHHALLGAEQRGARGGHARCGRSCPGVCIALLGAAFAFLNYAFDEISNPALRPVRRLSRRAVQPPSSLGGHRARDERRRQRADEPPGQPEPGQRRADGRARPARSAPATCSRSAISSVAYATDAGPVVAVDDVDLDLDARRVPCGRRRVRVRQVDAHVRHRRSCSTRPRASPAGVSSSVAARWH